MRRWRSRRKLSLSCVIPAAGSTPRKSGVPVPAPRLCCLSQIAKHGLISGDTAQRAYLLFWSAGP